MYLRPRNFRKTQVSSVFIGVAFPASATGGVISVDGKPTTLLLPSAQGSSDGNTHSGSSGTAGGLGVVGHR